MTVISEDLQSALRDEVDRLESEIALRQETLAALTALLDPDDDTPPPPPPQPDAVDEPEPVRRPAKSKALPNGPTTKERVLELLREGPHRAADLQRKANVTNPTMSNALNRLLDDGKIEHTGEEVRRSKVYRLRSTQVAGASSAKSKPAPPANVTQGPTLEGRVMACLVHQRPTLYQLCNELNEERETIEPILRKLRDENEARLVGGRWEAMP